MGNRISFWRRMRRSGLNGSRERNIGKRLAIVLDGVVLSAPVINAKIADNGVIEGMGSHDNAADLALNLKAGSLPASVEYLDEVHGGRIAGLRFD